MSDWVCWVLGTTLADGLRLFFDDPHTRGIIVIGEIGGEAEMEAADLIREHRRLSASAGVPPKPVVAMVAGHAGAVLTPRDASAEEKARALEDAGAVVVPHPGVMGETMRRLLGM